MLALAWIQQSTSAHGYPFKKSSNFSTNCITENIFKRSLKNSSDEIGQLNTSADYKAQEEWFSVALKPFPFWLLMAPATSKWMKVATCHQNQKL